jgi:hypothetical protein
MTLSLIKPPARYDQVYTISNNQTLEQEDLRNRKIGTDVEMGPREKLVMRSPSGARWQITVSDTGVIGATAL